jgi:opacity protein-like surface antigen
MKRIWASFIAVLAIVLSLSAQIPDSGLAVIKSIGYVKTDAGLEISVRIDGGYLHQTSALSSPNRLVIDVAPTSRVEARPAYDVNAFGVTTIRTGQYEAQISRVILDFSGPIPAYDIQKTASGLLITIGIAPKATEKIAAPTGEKRPAPKEEVEAPAAEAEGPAIAPAFYNTTAGIMIGTYKNDSGRFDEVYGSGTSIQFGINLSRTLLYFRGFQLDVSGEARTLSKTGQSTLSGDEAKFSMIPLSLGGRLLFQTKYIIPFIGFGADWFNYSEKSVLADSSGSASGYHFQAGVFIVVPGRDNFRVKLYYKFTKVTALENEIEVPLGGPEYGIGVSYGFNVLNKAVFMIR